MVATRRHVTQGKSEKYEIGDKVEVSDGWMDRRFEICIPITVMGVETSQYVGYGRIFLPPIVEAQLTVR
jgi:hypothetical protein